MDELAYKRIGPGRYDVYTGPVRLGWVIRRPDGWSAISVPKNGSSWPSVCGPPTETRREAAGRLLAVTGEPA